VTPEQARALLAAPELLAAADPDDLRAGELLRRSWPADLVAAATEQAELRRRAAEKFDRAADMLFTRAGLEQASGEPVARHRARRFAEVTGTVLDLCCGIGGDLLALGSVGPVVGVDRDETHAVCARRNAAVCGVDAGVAVADVRDLLVGRAAAVFVDPARRTGDDGSTRRGGYSPDLRWCLALPHDRVCVKAAPGVDRTGVPKGWETEFVAVARDLKEAVLWSPGWGGPAARATVLPSGDSLVADPATPRPGVRAPGRYLLDPSPAVTRAGAVADLAASVGGWQIDERIAFLSADEPLRSPFGRSFAVEASLPFGVKALAAELRRLDVGAVDLRRRGLAGDVDDLRRRLRPTGSRRATVMLTRVVDRPWTLVCTELADA
jgi:SAM-dependent methyltransferase